MSREYKQMTQEQIEEQDRKNTSIVRKVNLWQTFKFVKHLTCQREGCGCDLVPKKQKTKVILQCPKCKNIQSYVPRAVLTSKLSILNTDTGRFVDDVAALSDANDGTHPDLKNNK